MRTSATRPTIAEIDLTALRFNVRGIRRRIGSAVRLMAVVKANAYGHGSVGVARALDNDGADAFGVAFPEEGRELRSAGIKNPIHVFTLPVSSQLPLYLDHQLEPTVATEREVRLLRSAAERANKTLRVHLKIDTGMNRIGARLSEIDPLIRSLARSRRIEVKGLFTHFATADERDKRFTRLQLARFTEAVEYLQRVGISPADIHCANSAAILDLPEARFTMVRPGIMLYGYYPSETTTESIPLRPVMAIRSSVAMVKEVARGESVSYGRRFIARRKTRIATVPIGYADGYSRLLTGRTSVLINGRRRPVVGTICMDQIMVDAGREDVQAGDAVVIIGRQGREAISARDVARILGTIPYEVCCAVAARVPRIYRSV